MKQVHPDLPKAHFELNMKTKNNPSTMFEIYVRWVNQNVQILCYSIEEKMEGFLKRLKNLRDRLSETDFSLLKKKEELEKAFLKIEELSGPFISLNESLAIVPLFGNLTSEKVHAIESGILNSTYHTERDVIVFDFTAVGEMTETGCLKIQQLFQSLQLIGPKVVISGIKPKQTMEINRHNWLQASSFVPSISEALKRNLK